MKEQLTSLDTPALLLDVDQMEANIKDIVHFANKHQISYRPHVKTHKCISIAKRQLELGAVGVTVATVGEAEIMVQGGIKDILIAFPVASSPKLQRIKALLHQATLTIAVDSMEQAKILQETFKDESPPLKVWIKVNSGLNRCGVEPTEKVVELAKYIQSLSALRLDGLFTHAGHSYAATRKEELQTIAKEEAEAIIKSSALCEDHGIQIPNRSIGSTPTFKIGGKVSGITEIRPGNAVFYDMVQVGLGVATTEQCALSVLSTIASVKKDRLIIDAGSKTLALDQGAHGVANISGFGYIKEYPHLTISRLSEEHGVIDTNAEHSFKINDLIQIIPNHACTVVNLFDKYILHQKGSIIGKWPIDARGRKD